MGHRTFCTQKCSVLVSTAVFGFPGLFRFLFRINKAVFRFLLFACLLLGSLWIIILGGFSVLSEFSSGFSVLMEIFACFPVSDRPQMPPQLYKIVFY